MNICKECINYYSDTRYDSTHIIAHMCHARESSAITINKITGEKNNYLSIMFVYEKRLLVW